MLINLLMFLRSSADFFRRNDYDTYLLLFTTSVGKKRKKKQEATQLAICYENAPEQKFN